MRRLRFWLLLGLFFAFFPRPSAAQSNAISWQVTPGFDGSFKSGAWFPLTITISNNGPDISGTLEMQFRGAGAASYSQPIELPLNANKRVVLPVLSEINQDGSQQAELRLRSGSTLVHSERLDMNALANMRLVIGVVSDEDNALPELANVRPINDNGFGTTLLRLSSADVPDRAELLQTFDVLFVHGVDTSAWSEAQREVLRFWANNGGQLVVGGDLRVTRGIEAMLPATAQENNATTSARGLEATGWTVRDTATELGILQLQPRPDAEVMLSDQTGQTLLVRQQLGAGSITVAAFGLEALREVGDPATFWSRVLLLDLQPPPAIQLRDQGFSTLQQALTLPAIRLPSILSFLGFLVLYIVVIGPVNYFVLRRLDRREWAYFTIPLLVLLFSGAAYAWGTLGRGRNAIVTELAVVRVPNGAAQGQAISYFAVFSPSRHAYDVRFAPAALAADLRPVWERPGSAADVVFAEDSTRVSNLLIDVGAVRPLSVEQRVPAPQIDAVVAADGNQVTVRNRSDQVLEGVMLVRGDGQAQIIGDVAPGSEQTVNFAPDRFLHDGLEQASGVIDRQVVLSQLSNAIIPTNLSGGAPFPRDFGVPAVEPALPLEPTAVTTSGEPTQAADLIPEVTQLLYVLGWQAKAQTEVQLDGRPLNASGETLYVWPLRKER